MRIVKFPSTATVRVRSVVYGAAPIPTESLLKEVENNAKFQTTHLSITSVDINQFNTVRKCRKRLMETVDLDPLAKQELVTDLRDFFDEGTEGYYYQNGTPYRRGYLFCGPAGTGKTILSTAIASHYDLALYVIDLAGMNDLMLQQKV